MDKKDREFVRDLYPLATIGLNIVAATFIGLGIGWFIDHKLIGWDKSWFTLAFLIFGVVAGFRNMFMLARGRGGKDDGEGEDEGKGDGGAGN